MNPEKTSAPAPEPASTGAPAASNGLLVITGGSRGIGRATCLLAARRGYRVLFSYHQQAEAARSLASRICEDGGIAEGIRADVSVEADVLRLFETADRCPAPLAGLVNNAGVLDVQTRLEDMSAERIRRILAVNVLGVFLCAREAIRRLSTRRGGPGGSIVNVSSMAARLGAPNEYIDYAASKGAMDTMTSGLAREVAGEGIRVNAVRPGLIHTEMHASGGEPGRVERLAPGVPMGRGGDPREVARAILWLLGPEASYVTGSFTDVAGGR